MSNKKDFEVTDFKPHIERQIKMLINNCSLYDQGNFEHALTIASNLRTILHTAGKSKSLIQLTNIQHVYLFYTSQKTPYNVVMCLLLAHANEIRRNNNTRELVFLPNFTKYSSDHDGFLRFKKWWNQKIIVNDKHKYSRSDIVLLTANEHGGSHIDKNVNKSFNDLINDVQTPLTFVQQNSPNSIQHTTPINNYIYAVIRQIAHEVLMTFKQINDIEINYKPQFSNFKINSNFEVADIILVKGEEIRYPE